MISGIGLKAIGVAVAVIGFGVDLVTDYIKEKRLEETIDQKIEEALAEKENEEE